MQGVFRPPLPIVDRARGSLYEATLISPQAGEQPEMSVVAQVLARSSDGSPMVVEVQYSRSPAFD